jgi:predicted Zn-dependent protease with MMP-like domain
MTLPTLLPLRPLFSLGLGEPFPGLLLFHGIPRTEKSVFFSSPPDRIFLYQRNIEAVCANEAEVRRQIRATLLHEVGHYFGLSEDDLRGL